MPETKPKQVGVRRKQKKILQLELPGDKPIHLCTRSDQKDQKREDQMVADGKKGRRPPENEQL